MTGDPFQPAFSMILQEGNISCAIWECVEQSFEHWFSMVKKTLSWRCSLWRKGAGFGCGWYESGATTFRQCQGLMPLSPTHCYATDHYILEENLGSLRETNRDKDKALLSSRPSRYILEGEYLHEFKCILIQSKFWELVCYITQGARKELLQLQGRKDWCRHDSVLVWTLNGSWTLAFQYYHNGRGHAQASLLIKVKLCSASIFIGKKDLLFGLCQDILDTLYLDLLGLC